MSCLDRMYNSQLSPPPIHVVFPSVALIRAMPEPFEKLQCQQRFTSRRGWMLAELMQNLSMIDVHAVSRQESERVHLERDVQG